jgi:hypothetical protein
MILWRFKETPETREDFPCSAFRWVIETSYGPSCMSIGVVHQYQYKDTGEWHSSHTTVYEVGLARKFKFGREHWYYDGPHCSLSLGWLRFWWGGDPRTGWCKKCMPE